MMNKPDIFLNMPWKDLDEYHALAMKHGRFGMDLKKFMEKENKKYAIPEPKVKPKMINVKEFVKKANRVKKILKEEGRI